MARVQELFTLIVDSSEMRWLTWRPQISGSERSRQTPDFAENTFVRKFGRPEVQTFETPYDMEHSLC